MMNGLFGGVGHLDALAGMMGAARRPVSSQQNASEIFNAMFANCRTATGQHIMQMNRPPSPQVRECSYCGRFSSKESCPSCGAGKWK